MASDSETIVDAGDKWEVSNDAQGHDGERTCSVVLFFRSPGDNAAVRVTLNHRVAMRFAHAIINEVNTILSDD